MPQPPARPLQPADARDNLASQGITTQKLNGQVYTPLDLAVSVVSRLRWPQHGEGRLLDPACGDGVFLEAAVRKLVAMGRQADIPRIEGWDVDPDAVRACEARLTLLCETLGVSERPVVRHLNALEQPARPSVDAVVGNPPYLEAKRMPAGLKRALKQQFPIAARGAFDLYGVFTELALRWVSEGGELAYVIPNRVLVTSATGALREAILAAGEVGVADLSRERVFTDAAVYPVVLRVDTSRPSAYGVEDVDGKRLLGLSAEAISGLEGRWPLPAPPLQPLVERVCGRPTGWSRLRDRFEVRWTCSFHRAGLRDRYVAREEMDSRHARRFLGGLRYAGNRELAPYAIDWSGAWIDYDEDRLRADKNPLPALALFERPKVVVPQNVRRPRAALDRTGLVLKDTFLAVVAREAADEATWLPWLTIVLNSTVFHHLYEALYGGTRKGGGYLHVLGSYLHPLPIPDPPAEAAALHEALVDRPTDAALLLQADHMVEEAYALTPVERSAVRARSLPKA